MRNLLIVSAFLISTWAGECAAQSSNNSSKGSSTFANLSAGFGMNYGGLGGNFELGTGHFSGFAALGYAPETFEGIIRIESSFNYQVGVRYYFNVGNEFIFPRIGAAFGWITNYYNQRIGAANYNQNVQGGSLQLGVQIISLEGFVFNFDAGMGTNAAIIKPKSHPHFYNFYIRPCIGIGYDLSRLFNKDRDAKRVKNKAINPFD